MGNVAKDPNTEYELCIHLSIDSYVFHDWVLDALAKFMPYFGENLNLLCELESVQLLTCRTQGRCNKSKEIGLVNFRLWNLE